jgi:hypothetical protein
MQILAFSLGPLLGLVGVAFISLYSGLIIGTLTFLFVFLKPYFSDICLKNTAEDLGINHILLAEGKVKYHTGSEEVVGKLFLTKEKIVFVYNNLIDFQFPLTKIIRVKSEEKIIDFNNSRLTSILQEKSSNLAQVSAMYIDLAHLSSGKFYITVQQSIFINDFSFTVSNPSLWVKVIETRFEKPS